MSMLMVPRMYYHRHLLHPAIPGLVGRMKIGRIKWVLCGCNIIDHLLLLYFCKRIRFSVALMTRIYKGAVLYKVKIWFLVFEMS